MKKPTRRPLKIDTGKYTILEHIPPYTDIILRAVDIDRSDFDRIAALALSYPTDPRMVEMVRRAGDASAKVPYLLDDGETAHSILATLREVARPQVEYLKNLPDPIRATIYILLSINTLPRGYENYGIPALLEIDLIQREMIKSLKALMVKRQLAEDFHNANHLALQALDRDWPELRQNENAPWPVIKKIPEGSQMRFEPVFEGKRLAHLYEACVIVDPPYMQELQQFTPSVLKRPLPESQKPPATGSADWLLREVGKIGRHFTRALLDIIIARLDAEQVMQETHKDYELINRRALEALREFVEKTP